MTTTRHQWEGIAAREGCGGALVLDCVAVGKHLSALRFHWLGREWLKKPLDLGLSRIAPVQWVVVTPCADVSRFMAVNIWSDAVVWIVGVFKRFNDAINAKPIKVDHGQNNLVDLHLSALRLLWLGVCFDVDDEAVIAISTKTQWRHACDCLIAKVSFLDQCAAIADKLAIAQVLRIRRLDVCHPVAENHVCHHAPSLSVGLVGVNGKARSPLSTSSRYLISGSMVPTVGFVLSPQTSFLGSVLAIPASAAINSSSAWLYLRRRSTRGVRISDMAQLCSR